MFTETLDRIENAVTELATRAGPILGPVPTAYAIGKATLLHLAWPWPVALVAALVVECLGLATVNTALALWNYNKDKRKSDPRAPFALALALAGVYFGSAITLTVALDVAPSLALYAPALVPFLSLTGAGVLAIRADHRRRLENIAIEKATRRARREARKRGNVPVAGAERSAPRVRVSDDTLERAREILQATPTISGSELGRQLDRSERFGRKLKAELLPVIGDNGKARQ